MKRIGYARTTIIEDDLKNQLTTLQSFGCDDIFQETFDPQAEISVFLLGIHLLFVNCTI